MAGPCLSASAPPQFAFLGAVRLACWVGHGHNKQQAIGTAGITTPLWNRGVLKKRFRASRAPTQGTQGGFRAHAGSDKHRDRALPKTAVAHGRPCITNTPRAPVPLNSRPPVSHQEKSPQHKQPQHKPEMTAPSEAGRAATVRRPHSGRLLQIEGPESQNNKPLRPPIRHRHHFAERGSRWLGCQRVTPYAAGLETVGRKGSSLVTIDHEDNMFSLIY